MATAFICQLASGSYSAVGSFESPARWITPSTPSSASAGMSRTSATHELDPVAHGVERPLAPVEAVEHADVVAALAAGGRRGRSRCSRPAGDQHRAPARAAWGARPLLRVDGRSGSAAAVRLVCVRSDTPRCSVHWIGWGEGASCARSSVLQQSSGASADFRYHGPRQSWSDSTRRLEGPMLVRPVIHGDERGFFHESYRRNVYADLGIPEEFVQDNHSRSEHGDRARHALPGRRRDGEARPLRARGDPRRGGRPAAGARRPSASGRPSSSTTRTSTSSTARSASPTASACTATCRRDLQARRPTTTSRSSAASPTTTPTSRSPGRGRRADPVANATRTRPCLRDVQDELPFRY